MKISYFGFIIVTIVFIIITSVSFLIFHNTFTEDSQGGIVTPQTEINTLYKPQDTDSLDKPVTNSEEMEMTVSNENPIVSNKIITEPVSDLTQDLEQVELLDKPVSYNNMRVYEDLNQIILEVNGIKHVVDTGYPFKSVEVRVFRNLSFSPSGRFLSYEVNSYEGSSVKIYDTQKLELITSVLGGDYGFTQNEHFYYVCNITGYEGGVEASVYQLPDFTEIIDLYGLFSELESNYSFVTCKENTARNVITFDFYDTYDPTESTLHKTVLVDTQAGKLLSVNDYTRN